MWRGLYGWAKTTAPDPGVAMPDVYHLLFTAIVPIVLCRLIYFGSLNLTKLIKVKRLSDCIAFALCFSPKIITFFYHWLMEVHPIEVCE